MLAPKPIPALQTWIVSDHQSLTISSYSCWKAGAKLYSNQLLQKLSTCCIVWTAAGSTSIKDEEIPNILPSDRAFLPRIQVQARQRRGGRQHVGRNICNGRVENTLQWIGPCTLRNLGEKPLPAPIERQNKARTMKQARYCNENGETQIQTLNIRFTGLSAAWARMQRGDES